MKEKTFSVNNADVLLSRLKKVEMDTNYAEIVLCSSSVQKIDQIGSRNGFSILD